MKATATVVDSERPIVTIEETVLRKVEQEVLDQHHRQFALLLQTETVAIDALLRCFVQRLGELRVGRDRDLSNVPKARIANALLRGLGHCLRWAKECSPSRVLVPTRTLREDAFELLNWGVAYDPLFNQHSAYSRKHVRADVDASNKTITFLPASSASPYHFCTQVESKKASDDRRAGARPDSRIVELWNPSHGFDVETLRTCGAIDVACSWMESECLPELRSADILMGCTVGELRRVLATIYVFSFIVTELGVDYDVQSSFGAKQQRCRMIEWLAGLSGVPEPSVDSIVSVLTFNHKNQHVSLAQQPFVLARDGHIWFVPCLMRLLDLQHMFVSALNKDEQGKDAYSRTINTIETAGVEAVARELSAAAPSGVQVVPRATFALPDGRRITPDIVIASDLDRTVLVMDLKYATPPFGPADVALDIAEFEKWRVQMAKYVNGFQDHSEVLGQRVRWSCQGSATIFGLILTRWPFPVPVELSKPVGSVDWPSLRAHIQEARPWSVHELVKWATNRPDVSLPKKLVPKAKNVDVGDWKYQYFVWTVVDSENGVQAP